MGKEVQLLSLPGLIYGATCFSVASNTIQRYRGAAVRKDCRGGCEDAFLKVSILGSALMGGISALFSLSFFWYTCVGQLHRNNYPDARLGYGFWSMIVAMSLKVIIGSLQLGLKAHDSDNGVNCDTSSSGDE